jgi:hypothetical protein
LLSGIAENARHIRIREGCVFGLTNVVSPGSFPLKS